MNQILKCKSKASYCFYFGVLILLICFAFFLIQGESIIVNAHDQLDSEVTYYVLRSQSFDALFRTRFEQFMLGSADVSIASIGTLLFYFFMTPIYAFITNLFFVRIIAYVSLFCLLYYLDVNPKICFFVSIIFSFLPIYSVYGLSSMGIPLVCLGMRNLRKKNYWGYIEIAIYGFFSSLVLVGFAVVGMMALTIVFRLIRKERIVEDLCGLFELLFIYIISNANLIRVILIKDGYISQRVESNSSSDLFFKRFYEMLLSGQYHAVSRHKYIWIVVGLACILSLIYHQKIRDDAILKKQFFSLLSLLCGVLIIAVVYAFYFCEYGVDFRNLLFSESALKSFQFNRVYWLYPSIWYTVFGVSLSIISRLLLLKKRKIACVITLIFAFIPGLYALKPSDVLQNILKQEAYSSRDYSWKKFYSEELFEDISEYIGKEKDEYHVVSVGLYPNIALYNGFYVLDGYSNDYDLSYKNQFAKVVRNELEKNEILKSYFYDWGNRCYVFSSEIGKKFIIGKNEDVDIDLDIDVNELKKMGGEYVFSAAKINNASEIGLKYRDYFDNQDSYYGIFLYEVMK